MVPLSSLHLYGPWKISSIFCLKYEYNSLWTMLLFLETVVVAILSNVLQNCRISQVLPFLFFVPSAHYIWKIVPDMLNLTRRNCADSVSFWVFYFIFQNKSKFFFPCGVYTYALLNLPSSVNKVYLDNHPKDNGESIANQYLQFQIVS
jgi:hypothetical protein